MRSTTRRPVAFILSAATLAALVVLPASASPHESVSAVEELVADVVDWLEDLVDGDDDAFGHEIEPNG